jgi:pyruvyl transferase EpsO
LLNFPAHGNAGDPAIWLGTLEALKRIDCPIAYSCSPDTFDVEALQAAHPEGPLLLNGGGNFGDAYRPQQALREHVLANMKDHRIVQLPQSIWFRTSANEDRVRRLVAEHGRFTLMVRESASALRARSFDCPVLLAPDMAVALPQPTRQPPVDDILWLYRQETSPEARPGQLPPDAPGVQRVEWLAGLSAAEAAWPDALRQARDLCIAVGRDPDARRHRWSDAAASFEPLAQAWVDRGLHILSRGRVVVTDRLHGHLLSLKLGIPHVLLDNAYGKCRSTLDTWTGGSPLVHWANNADEALDLARSLL